MKLHQKIFGIDLLTAVIVPHLYEKGYICFLCKHIAILAGVVNFLPHPSPPRTRGPGVRNSQMI